MEQFDLFKRKNKLKSEPTKTIKTSYFPCDSLDEFISKAIHRSLDDDLLVDVIFHLISEEETRKPYTVEYSYLNNENKKENITYQDVVKFIKYDKHNPVVLEPEDDVFEEIGNKRKELEDEIKKKHPLTEIKPEDNHYQLKIYSCKKKAREILKK